MGIVSSGDEQGSAAGAWPTLSSGTDETSGAARLALRKAMMSGSGIDSASRNDMSSASCMPLVVLVQPHVDNQQRDSAFA